MNIKFYNSLSNSLEDFNTQQDKNSVNAKNGFFSKTKQWAGNMWNSLKNIQFKKMFAKLGAVAFAARAKTNRDILEDRKPNNK